MALHMAHVVRAKAEVRDLAKLTVANPTPGSHARKSANEAQSLLSGLAIAQSNDFVFYSEFSLFEITDEIGVWQRTVKFFVNHPLKAGMIRFEFFDMLLNSHTCSP